MKILEILKGVRELLSDEKKWIKGQYEREGCYCLLGAICHVNNDRLGKFFKPSTLDAVYSLEQNVPEDLGMVSITGVNDHPSFKYKDLIAWLDKTIKSEENKNV